MLLQPLLVVTVAAAFLLPLLLRQLLHLLLAAVAAAALLLVLPLLQSLRAAAVLLQQLQRGRRTSRCITPRARAQTEYAPQIDALESSKRRFVHYLDGAGRAAAGAFGAFGESLRSTVSEYRACERAAGATQPATLSCARFLPEGLASGAAPPSPTVAAPSDRAMTPSLAAGPGRADSGGRPGPGAIARTSAAAAAATGSRPSTAPVGSDGASTGAWPGSAHAGAAPLPGAAATGGLGLTSSLSDAGLTPLGPLALQRGQLEARSARLGRLLHEPPSPVYASMAAAGAVGSDTWSNGGGGGVYEGAASLRRPRVDVTAMFDTITARMAAKPSNARAAKVRARGRSGAARGVM